MARQLILQYLNYITPKDISNIISQYVGYEIIDILCKHLHMSENELSEFSNNKIIAFLDMQNVPGFKHGFQIRIIPVTKLLPGEVYVNTFGDEVIYSYPIINTACEFHYYYHNRFGFYPDDDDFILRLLGTALKNNALSWY